MDEQTVRHIQKLIDLHWGVVRDALELEQTLNGEAYTDQDMLNARAVKGATTRMKSFRLALCAVFPVEYHEYISTACRINT